MPRVLVRSSKSYLETDCHKLSHYSLYVVKPHEVLSACVSATPMSVDVYKYFWWVIVMPWVAFPGLFAVDPPEMPIEYSRLIEAIFGWNRS